MSDPRARFELALERLKPSDWQLFEQLASAFLAAEYPNLRTVAAASGDGGRDSELYSPTGLNDAVFQYSVADDWAKKIRHTVKRLKAELPATRILHYVTNQIIGAKSDALKRELTAKGIYLDVMDASYFLDRCRHDQARITASENLARRIVDPLLSVRGVVSSHAQALNTQEATTALVFLELQRQDDDANRNLTRSSFEALVRAALHGSTSDERVKRSAIYDRVHEFLPRHSAAELKPFVDTALERLKKKKAIGQTTSDDTFHINFHEAERLRNASVRLLLMKSAFEKDIADLIASSAGMTFPDLSKFINIVRECIERYFLKRGEEFASAVVRGEVIPMNDGDLKAIVVQCSQPGVAVGRDAVGYLLHVVTTVLNNPSEATLDFLRLMSESYTLLSFLSETPDVQDVTKKLFAHGEIWLDTTVLLPLIPETLLPEPLRPFTSILAQLKKSGATLFTTQGVVEEIERHINRCIAFQRAPAWEGNTPYIMAKYVIAGGSRDRFASWIERFMGGFHPVDDIAAFLRDFGVVIETSSPDGLVPEDTRLATYSYWQSVHDRRRGASEYNMNNDRLARHDAESALHVMASRNKQGERGAFGYASWWFTLDSAASHQMLNALKKDGVPIKHSIVLSLDYLVRYLAFGPSRELSHQADTASRAFFRRLLWTTFLRICFRSPRAFELSMRGLMSA